MAKAELVNVKLTQQVGGRVVVICGQAALILKPSSIDTDKSGQWHVPGGVRDDIRERLPITACRELQEETGITAGADQLRLVSYGEWQIEDKGDGVWYLSLFFSLDITGQPDIHLSHEHDDYRWVTLKELDQIEIKSEAKRAIRLALGVNS